MSCVSDNENLIVLELTAGDDKFEFAQSISSAFTSAESRLLEIDEKLSETKDTIASLTPNCDKLDYALAASSGALCGVIDIFLVGKPGESPIGDLTDKWFENRTKDFAKLCGWKGGKNGSLSSAIKHLEEKFKIPYDQRGAGDAAKEIFNLNPANHHFKSLGHNPTLLGLFYSILDQFGNEKGPTSHFVSEGMLITLEDADGEFELRGHNIPSKLFCGFVNWLGHLISDMSGSSTSKGRGMGIPAPLLAWTNDIIAIKSNINELNKKRKSQIKIPVTEFDKNINELAMEIYKEGYDTRFQAAQAIPVLINELLVRFMYSIRRAIQYFLSTPKEECSFKLLWKSCEPFSNATVKRMLTVAHGTFCLVDIGDATIRGVATGGGTFNIAEFVMRLNIVGIGRFSISLYGEAKRGLKRSAASENAYFLEREKLVVNNYIEGLKCLNELYDDKLLLTFIEDLKSSDMYIQAFEKSAQLAELRKVPEDKILKTKTDIDNYFQGGSQDE